MSEAKRTRGDNTAGSSERNTPIPSRTGTPPAGDVNQSSSRTTRSKEKWEKKIAQERAHRVRDVPVCGLSYLVFGLGLCRFGLVGTGVFVSVGI